MRSKKDSEFKVINKLNAEEFKGVTFSHVVHRVNKLPKNKTTPVLDEKGQPKKKYQSVWFRKEEKDIGVAHTEVIAQELFRLFIPGHPKVRLSRGELGENFLLSKEVPGYRCLGDINPRMINANIKNKTFKTRLFNQRIYS